MKVMNLYLMQTLLVVEIELSTIKYSDTLEYRTTVNWDFKMNFKISVTISKLLENKFQSNRTFT